MDWVQAVILALIQGLTEFLPISSSAHLILPNSVLGWPDQGLAFDVAVHVGTLSAVVLYFRQDLLRMFFSCLTSLGSRSMNPDTQLALVVALGTVPAGVAGIMLGDYIEMYLRSAWVIAATTILFGILLWVADRAHDNASARPITAFGWREGLLVGLAQMLALVPGTSRSGVTITAALMLGFQRDASARFSFLLSIPVILGAGLVKLKDLLEMTDPVPWDLIALGTAISAVSAYLCIHWFLRLLDRIGMTPFVIYRLLLGAVLILVLLLR